MPRRTKADAIVDYILRQREHGWRDGKIREHMELTKGYTPEMLNRYFVIADKREMQKHITKVIAPVAAIVLLAIGALFMGGPNGITAAATWDWASWDWSSWTGSGSSTDCGDAVSTSNVFDLSTCISDEEATKENILCYINKDHDVDDLLNTDWYSTNLGIDLTSYSTITTLELLGNSVVLPWDASGTDVECLTWDYGRAKDSDWHQCMDDDDDGVPENLVFYYNDVTTDSDVGVGHISTELTNDGSYYLCYDELECTTARSGCSSDSYCVGRLDSRDGSGWYDCDTTNSNAVFYRCCTGGCSGIDMQCAGYIVDQDDSSNYAAFSECTEDGTSACCSSSTACVYDGECYDYLEQTEFGGLEMWCQVDNHWCPFGFAYDSTWDECVIEQEACYDPTDTDYCNYVFGTDDIDDWESDADGTHPCVQEDASATSTHDGCIYQTISGMDYYFYQAIEWY